MLRTRAGYEGLPALLKYPHLQVPQRVQLVRSFGNYLLDPPISLEPMIDYLNTKAGEPIEVKRAGVEVLSAGGTIAGRKAEDWLLGLLPWAEHAAKAGTISAAESTRLRRDASAAIDQLRKDRKTQESLRGLKTSH